MANIAISDATHDEIQALAYDHHKSMKDIVERMWVFVNKHKEDFTVAEEI